MSDIPHLRRHGAATQLVVDGEPFIVLGGQVHNSSSSSLAHMERVWERIVELRCNTAIVPVYWELVEPREGEFDFSLLDGLIDGARRRGLRLVLLWFATWKNAISTYAPEWVKTDLARFPRAQGEAGRNSLAITSLSDAACDADAKAFAALMRHLREIDGREHTVIIVQVENETGFLDASRDHSPLAREAFGKPVPEELLAHMAENEGALRPELLGLWRSAGQARSGTWTEVFGPRADEVFMAWHVAGYVQRVAAAGRREYPLPMYANAWLVHHEGQEPGKYPSGGPVSRMMDVWKCAAPDIFTLAPDIYLPWFAEVCADYVREDNPLLIPEASREAAVGSRCLYAIGRHDAICFSPFGIESIDSPRTVGVVGPFADGAIRRSGQGAGATLAKTYKMLSRMMPIITKEQGTGRMTGFLQGPNQVDVIEFAGARLRLSYTEPSGEGRTPGGGLVISTSPNEYVVAGLRCGVDFLPVEGGPRNLEYISLEEGEYRGGEWVPGRRLNGDELALRLGDEPAVRRAKVYGYD